MQYSLCMLLFIADVIATDKLFLAKVLLQ
ncbi:hypothetical protein ID866_8759 [Astraeus odoratus]|nr:hypothetical protein ID866_8759 [Astraeus odoratus]